MRTDLLSARRAGFALAIAAAAFMTACDRDTTAKANAEGQAVADKISAAAKKTEQAVKEEGEKLKPQLQQASAELKPKLEAAGKKISAAAEKTGDQVKSAATSDAGITAAIKASYVKEPNLSALKIDVDTHGGVVTLNGVVQDASAKQRAEQVASSVKGVSSVKNHLTVKQG